MPDRVNPLSASVSKLNVSARMIRVSVFYSLRRLLRSTKEYTYTGIYSFRQKINARAPFLETLKRANEANKTKFKNIHQAELSLDN